MKKVLFIICAVLSVISFSACKSSKSASVAGSDDIAYVYFVSGGQYAGKTVNVKVDDYTNFDATPAKSKSEAEAKGVGAGSRHLVITSNGKTIYDETISVKTGAKKYIKLP